MRCNIALRAALLGLSLLHDPLSREALLYLDLHAFPSVTVEGRPKANAFRHLPAGSSSKSIFTPPLDCFSQYEMQVKSVRGNKAECFA